MGGWADRAFDPTVSLSNFAVSAFLLLLLLLLMCTSSSVRARDVARHPGRGPAEGAGTHGLSVARGRAGAVCRDRRQGDAAPVRGRRLGVLRRAQQGPARRAQEPQLARPAAGVPPPSSLPTACCSAAGVQLTLRHVLQRYVALGPELQFYVRFADGEVCSPWVFSGRTADLSGDFPEESTLAADWRSGDPDFSLSLSPATRLSGQRQIKQEYSWKKRLQRRLGVITQPRSPGL